MFKSKSHVVSKKAFLGLLSLSLIFSATVLFPQGYSADEAMATVNKKTEAPANDDLSKHTFANVTSLELVKNPDQYLEKDVTFKAVFNRFSDLGLDYPKALRETKDYVAMLILRPDVGSRTIPMSELKLFFPRKKSAEVLELDTGDEIEIKGNVFSNALGDPWVDVLAVKIVAKAPQKDKNKDKATEGEAIGE